MASGIQWTVLKIAIIALTIYGAMPFDFCKQRFLPLMDSTISTKWAITMHPRCTKSKIIFIIAFVICIGLIGWLQIGRSLGPSVSENNRNYHLGMLVPLVSLYLLTLVECLLIPESQKLHYVVAFFIAAIMSYITVISLHNYNRPEKFMFIERVTNRDIAAITTAVVIACVFGAGLNNYRIFAIFEYTLLTFFCAIGIVML